MKTLISNALDEHDRVIVMTQDNDLVREMLLTVPGKWRVGIDLKLWDVEKCVKCDGKKVKLGEPCNAGVDEARADRLIFTKDPLFPFRPKDFIITTPFDFPIIHWHDSLPIGVAIHKYGDKVSLMFESSKDVSDCHDRLCMQGMDHTMRDEEEPGNIHIDNRLMRVADGCVPIIYKFIGLSTMMMFDNAPTVVLQMPDTPNVPGDDLVNMVHDCLMTMPNMSMAEAYISRMTLKHPKTIKQVLNYMRLCGMVNRSQIDTTNVSIRKMYLPEPIKDPEYHAIPEGDWKVSEIARHLKIHRDELFPLLKKWEGKGLMFGYSPTRIAEMWSMTGDCDANQYMYISRFVSENHTHLRMLSLEGGLYLNQLISKRVQQHCSMYNMKAIIDGQEVSMNNSAIVL